MEQLLPPDICEHVSLLASNTLFHHLEPSRRGCTENAFFTPNEKSHRIPQVEKRPVGAPLPEMLRLVYERYDNDTEFSAPGNWIFMCEQEIAERVREMIMAGQTRVVDLAVQYVGMGHLRVLAYDPQEQKVFVTIDGGANAYDSQDNHDKRIKLNVDEVDGKSFKDWWAALQQSEKKNHASEE